MFLVTKRSHLLFVGIVLLLFGFPLSNVHAIDNNCKNTNLYETEINIAPTSGTADTEISIEMKFRWNGFAYQGCRNTNLNFDLTWGIPGTNVVGEYDEIPIGKVGENWVTKVVKTSVKTLPGLDYGPTTTGTSKIWFGMMVEDDDWTGGGDNLFNPIKKEFTFSVGNQICAYVAPDNRYQCISGSETTANCSSRTECSGKSCQKIDSSQCGSLTKIWACTADNGKYACSNGNRQDLSDVPNNACTGKTPIQISPSQCGQTVSSGGTGGTGGTTSGTAPRTYSFEIKNPLKGGPNDLFDVINIMTKWLLNISIPLAVIFILWAGFLMITAGPTPAKYEKGKKILFNVVVGLAVIFIGRGFITLIYSVLELGSSSAGNEQQAPLVNGKVALCVKDQDCSLGSKCDNGICKRQGGNAGGELCRTGSDCAQGYSCDSSGDAKRVVNGTTYGTCYAANLCQEQNGVKFCINKPSQACNVSADCEPQP